MAHEFIDLKGLLFLVLIAMPRTLSTNIDCGGKPFHCLNTTHFMICVDLGGGLSSTIDDFIIPCPPTTVCQKDNRFECDFPKIEVTTTPLSVITVSNENEETFSAQNSIPPDKETTVLPYSEITYLTMLPTNEKTTSSFNNELLDSLKHEFNGVNEKFFEEHILKSNNAPNLRNVTDEKSNSSLKIYEKNTMTDKYTFPKQNAEALTYEVSVASRTDTLTLKTTVSSTEGFINVNKHNYNNTINSTKDVDIDLDPDNIPFNNQSDLGLQKKVFKLVPVLGTVSDMTPDNLNQSKTILATPSKYNDSKKFDNVIASKITNPLLVNTKSRALSYSVKSINETLKEDYNHKDMFESVTASQMVEITSNFTFEASKTTLPKLNDTASLTERLIIINDNDSGNDHNTTEEINQNYINEQNITIDKYVKKLELTTASPNFSVEKNYTINQYPGNDSGNLKSQQKGYIPAPMLRSVSDMSVDSLGIKETVFRTTSKYNDLDNNAIGSEAKVNSSITVKANSTAKTYSNESYTGIDNRDEDYMLFFEPVTASLKKNTTTNFTTETSGTDIPKLREIFISNNKHNTGYKHDATNEIDQNYINELNQTIDEFVKMLDLTTSLPNFSVEKSYNTNEDSVNISRNLDLQQNLSNPAPIPGVPKEITISTSGTDDLLVSNGKYNDSDNFHYVIASEVNYKDEFMSVTASPTEITTVNYPVTVSSDLETTNSISVDTSTVGDGIRTAMMSNLTFKLPKKHYSLHDKNTDLSMELITQSSFKNNYTSEQNYLIHNSNTHSLNNVVNQTTAKGQTVAIKKSNVEFLKTGTGTTPQIITHNMESTANLTHKISGIATTVRTTLMKNTQTSVTESPTLRMDEQLIHISDNSPNNSSFENSTKNVPLQASASYFPSTIEEPTAVAPPLGNNFTIDIFSEISTGTEAPTVSNLDFIQHESNYTINNKNMPFNIQENSKLSLSAITHSDISLINKATYNMSHIPQSEAVTNPGNNSKRDNTITEEERDISSNEGEKTAETIDNAYNNLVRSINCKNSTFSPTVNTKRDTSVNQSYTVESEAYQLSIPLNCYNFNGEPSNTSRNFTEHTHFVKTENASVLPKMPISMKTDSATDSNFINNRSVVEEPRGINRIVQSTPIATNTSDNQNKVLTENTTIPIATNLQDNIKTGNMDMKIVSGPNLNSNVAIATLQKVHNESQLQYIVTVTDNDLTLKPLGSIVTNLELQKQNGMSLIETTKLQTTTTVNPLVTDSSSLTNLSIESKLLTGTVGHTNSVYPESGTLVEYKENYIKGSKTAINSYAKPLLDPLKKTHGSNGIPRELVIDSNQVTLISKTNESKSGNKMTNSSILDIFESQSFYIHNMSKLLTYKDVTDQKQSNIIVNQILPSSLLSISKYKNVSVKVDKIVYENVTQSTKETIADDLKIILKSPTLNETTKENHSNITENRIAPNTMVSMSQKNTDALGEATTQIVSSNIALSIQQTVTNDLDRATTLPTQNKTKDEKQSNNKVEEVSPSTTKSISHQNQDNLVKIGKQIMTLNDTQSTQRTVANDLVSILKLTILNETSFKNHTNITVNKIAPNPVVLISPKNKANSGKAGKQIVSANVSQRPRQTLVHDLDGASVLPTPNEFKAKKQSNITVTQIAPNIVISMSQKNTDDSVEAETQIMSANFTQSIQRTVAHDLDGASTLPTPDEAKAKNQLNITVNQIAPKTVLLISRKNKDDLVEPGTQIVSANVTQSTQPTVIRDLDGASILPTPDEAKAKNQLNITVNQIAPKTVLLISRKNKDDLVEAATQIMSANVTQSTQPTVGHDLDGASTLLIPNEAKSKKQSNNTVSQILFSTMTSVSQQNTDNWVKIGKQIWGKNWKANESSISILKEDKEQIDSGNKSDIYRIKAKGNNLTELKNLLIEQTSNVNIRFPSNIQISNKTNSSLANGSTYNPERNTYDSKEENTAFTVDCLKLPRGKYADSKDCRKFYICIGKTQPAVGTCPNNTVFSEINKQCTRNLSHCVRSNQFHCLYEGRFCDFLRDNIYYICVKNNKNVFFRYKLQCLHGYHLNKDVVRCEKNIEILKQSETSLSNFSNDRNRSMSKSNVSENSENNEFECRKEGKFHFPKDCRKYYVCTRNRKEEYRRRIKRCSRDEIFDKKDRKCVSADSEEC